MKLRQARKIVFGNAAARCREPTFWRAWRKCGRLPREHGRRSGAAACRFLRPYERRLWRWSKIQAVAGGLGFLF